MRQYYIKYIATPFGILKISRWYDTDIAIFEMILEHSKIISTDFFVKLSLIKFIQVCDKTKRQWGMHPFALNI